MNRNNWKLFIFPAIFVLIMAPVVVIALLTFQPSADAADCGTTAALPAPHSHGVGLATEIQGDMQLIFNVSAAAELYQVVDGKLEICSGDLSGDMKHITVDVNDARLQLGERLPVEVHLTVREADSGDVMIDAQTPAMYAPGHGYHFGDNFLLPNDAAYDWTITISPVEALRQAGAQELWLEPVTWQGEFRIDAEGSVVGRPGQLQPVGEFVRSGLHVLLSQQEAVELYEVEDGATVAQAIPGDAVYFAVDVTDHAVNYEEKLVGADVTLTFAQGDETFEAAAEPVISPVYGFQYGANVALGPGEWAITVTVDGLDFLRHAGAAVSLPRNAISGTLTYTAAEAAPGA